MADATAYSLTSGGSKQRTPFARLPATIKGGGPFGKFLKGYEYTIVYNEDKYQETRVYDETMRIPA